MDGRRGALVPLAAGFRLRATQARCRSMSWGDRCQCQQKNSDGASPREEVASLACPMTNLQPETRSQGACQILHHILWQHPSPREEVACPDCPMTNTLPEMPSQGAGRIIHHVRWQHPQVITVTGPARTIYIGGQDAVDAQGNIVGKGDLAAQTHQVLRNLRTALAAASARPEHIIKWNVYHEVGKSYTHPVGRSDFEVKQRKSAPIIGIDHS